MGSFEALLPAGWILANVRDIEYRGFVAGMPRPDYRAVDGDRLIYSYRNADPDPVTVSAWQAAIAANAGPEPSAPWNVVDAQEAQIRAQLATLRNYLPLASPSAAQRLAMEKALVRAVLNLSRQFFKDYSGTD